MYKKVLSVIIACFMLVSFSFQDISAAAVETGDTPAKAVSIESSGYDTYNDFEYDIAGSGIRIQRYTGSKSEVTIPDEIAGTPVTSISSSAFYTCTSVTSVYIPESISSIEQRAFTGCKNIKQFKADSKNQYYSSDDGILFNKYTRFYYKASFLLLLMCPLFFIFR